MSDFTARAMLARNAMNIYMRLPKFLISTKLTYSSQIPYVTVLRHFLIPQFGPITTKAGGAGIKSEYYYQCLKALESAGVFKIIRADNYVKATPVHEASLDTIKQVQEDFGCNMYSEEFFDMATCERQFTKTYKTLSEHFVSPAKMIHFAIMNEYTLKNQIDVAALNERLSKGKDA